MKVKLLVVDDELQIRDLLRRHFCYLGYDVETANDGFDALEKLSQSKVDIVISDIVMPRMDGIELLRNIRRDYPMTHVIMITGYVTLEHAFSCMRHGADTCIFKPLEDLSELEEAVAYAVARIKHWQQKLRILQAMKPAFSGAPRAD